MQTVTITNKEIIAEAERELKMRERVFPGWVAAQRMTQQESEYQLQGIKAILADYTANEPEQTDLFGGSER